MTDALTPFEDQVPKENVRKPRRIRKWVIASLVLLFPIAVVFALLRQQSQLESFVSPPMDSKGTRIQYLVPCGWKVTHYQPPKNIARGHDSATVWLEPPQRMSWLPQRVRHLLHFDEVEEGTLNVAWMANVGSKPLDHTDVRKRKPFAARTDRRRYVSGKGTWLAIYIRSNEREFWETKEKILNSIKVL